MHRTWCTIFLKNKVTCGFDYHERPEELRVCEESRKHKTGEDREGDTEMTDIYIYVYACICVCVYIYIGEGRQTQMEREREREQSLKTCNYAAFRHTTMRGTDTNG